MKPWLAAAALAVLGAMAAAVLRARPAPPAAEEPETVYDENGHRVLREK